MKRAIYYSLLLTTIVLNQSCKKKKDPELEDIQTPTIQTPTTFNYTN